MSRRRPPRALVWAWLGLLALLALTVTLAHRPLGSFNLAVALAIAVCKALIVAAVFMELRRGPPLAIVFAGAGFFWLGIMLWLASTDFATRAGFPPGPSLQARDIPMSEAEEPIGRDVRER